MGPHAPGRASARDRFLGVWLGGGFAVTEATAAIRGEFAARLSGRPLLLFFGAAATLLAAYSLAATCIAWRSAERYRGHAIWPWLARVTTILPFAAVLSLAIDGGIVYLILMIRPNLLTAI